MKIDNYVNGRWQASDSGAVSDYFDPSSGERIGEQPDSTLADVDRAVEAARAAQPDWAALSVAERVEALGRMAEILTRRSGELVEPMTADTGCATRLVPGLQLGGTSMLFDRWPELAHHLGHPEPAAISTSTGLGQWEVRRDPLGVVAALTPFNVPMYVVAQKTIPALMAGNTVVVKPSPLAPVGPTAFAELAEEAKLPPGVFNLVHGDVATSQHLVSHPGINAVSFTGSTAVGSAVMASAAGSLKRVQLELGGKSPAVILPDADLNLAMPGAVFGSYLHAGQVCVACSRIIAPSERYDEICDYLVSLVAQLKHGSAHDPQTDIGPVMSMASAERIQRTIVAAQDAGAKVIGEAEVAPDLPSGGYYVTPTVLSGVTRDMAVAQDEVFGPVITVMRADSVEDAIDIANSTKYGLAASVWGADLTQARAVGARIESGTVWINEYGVADVAASPMEGWKVSGMGSQYGVAALHDLTRAQSVYTALDPEPSRRPYTLLGSNWTL